MNLWNLRQHDGGERQRQYNICDHFSLQVDISLIMRCQDIVPHVVCNRYNYIKSCSLMSMHHGDVIKWKHIPRYCPIVRGIHRSPLNSPYKGQWCEALIFCLICVWINNWVNNHEASCLRCHRVHYDFTVINVFGLMPFHPDFSFYGRTTDNIRTPNVCRIWCNSTEL